MTGITERDIVAAARNRGLTWAQIEAETYLKESYLLRWYRDIPRFFVKAHAVRPSEAVTAPAQRGRPIKNPQTRDEKHLVLLRASSGRF